MKSHFKQNFCLAFFLTKSVITSSVFKVDKISDSMQNIAKSLRRSSVIEDHHRKTHDFTLFKQETDLSVVQFVIAEKVNIQYAM